MIHRSYHHHPKPIRKLHVSESEALNKVFSAYVTSIKLGGVWHFDSQDMLVHNNTLLLLLMSARDHKDHYLFWCLDMAT